MAIHDDLVQPVAIHPAAFVGNTDPALDPDNNVQANKLWIDTTGGVPPFVLKKRNVANTLWEEVGGGGVATGPIGPPGFAEEGDHGEDGIPGPPGVAGASGSVAEDGWIAAGETWTFAAADAPTFTFTITGSDQTAKYTPGTRLKLTHSAAIKYFIVTASAFAAGDTTVTVYGGTDYTLAAGAITLPFFSRMKGPAGFPLDPSKWTVTLSDASQRTQLNPVSGTYYNLGSLQIDIPIGVWRVIWQVVGECGDSSVTTLNYRITLSTANNSQSDVEFSIFYQQLMGSDSVTIYQSHTKQKWLTLASKTPYFLNMATFIASAETIDFRGDVVPTKVEAICAYL